MDAKSRMYELNGNNYPTWKIQCKMALIKDGLWSVVNGTEKAPANDDEGDANAVMKYEAKRDRALATIVLAINPSLLYLLGGDPEDPEIVWNKLSDQFQRKTWANKLSLRRKLYNLRLKDNDSMQGHIKEMTEIFEELSIIGDAVKEEDRVVHLLASLPEKYDMLVTALESNDKVPKLETVTERLLHGERKLNKKT